MTWSETMMHDETISIDLDPFMAGYLMMLLRLEIEARPEIKTNLERIHDQIVGKAQAAWADNQ